MIAVIDYQAGNLQSVVKALQYIDAPCRIVSQAAELKGCDQLILPGVGAFGAAMHSLNQSGLTGELINWLKAGKPFLGICLGMQLLFDASEEKPGIAGLGFFSGSCRKFTVGKVPQIGWNRLEIHRADNLFAGIEPKPFFYFLHSFYAAPADPSVVLASAEYHLRFPAVIKQGAIAAVQFHPEKSGLAGIQFLRNWVKA